MSRAQRAAPQPERAPDRVYDAIKRLILNNDLPPGSFVLQEDLAVRLGVSRTPVREALVRLEHDGLIEVRPRRGMRVLPVSIESMREIYQILTALESEAARLLAERRISGPELAPLKAAASEMDAALARDDLEAWAEADARFHAALVSATGNDRLVAMVDMITDQAHRVRRLTLFLRARPTQSNEDHRDLIAAIACGDADRAYAIHRRHRTRNAEALIGLVERLRISSA